MKIISEIEVNSTNSEPINTLLKLGSVCYYYNKNATTGKLIKTVVEEPDAHLMLWGYCGYVINPYTGFDSKLETDFDKTHLKYGFNLN